MKLNDLVQRIVGGLALLLALCYFVGDLSAGRALHTRYGYTASLFTVFSYDEVVYFGAHALYAEVIVSIPTLLVVALIRVKASLRLRRVLSAVAGAILTLLLPIYWLSAVYIRRLVIDWLLAHPYVRGVLLGAALYVLLELAAGIHTAFAAKWRTPAAATLLVTAALPVFAYRPTGLPSHTDALVTFADGRQESLGYLTAHGPFVVFVDHAKQSLRFVSSSEVKGVALSNTEPNAARDQYWRWIGKKEH